MNEWNGMPPNKEYRGWHWLYLYNGLPIPAYWDDHWLINGQQIKAEDLNPEIKYWGQCLTPSEIEAKNACIAELEAEVKMWRDENFKKQTAYQQRGVRIAELEVALRAMNLRLLKTYEFGSSECLRIIDAALAGGEDE